jgi:hypothetical protein
MQLSDSQKSSLKLLLQSPQWKIVEAIEEELVKNITLDSSIRETTDETLKETYLKEGRVQGIRLLIQELFNQINA